MKQILPHDPHWAWRRIGPDETDAFLKVSLETFHAAFREAYKPHQANYDAYIQETYTPETVKQVLQDSAQQVYWLLYGEEIAGIIRFGINPKPDMLPNAPLVEIKRFYLYPAFHGKGGAQWLMDAVAQWAMERSLKGIWLIVAEASERAISFYLKWGFKQVGSAPFRMGDMIEQDRVMLWMFGEEE